MFFGHVLIVTVRFVTDILCHKQELCFLKSPEPDVFKLLLNHKQECVFFLSAAILGE